jgi:hypothetical protein
MPGGYGELNVGIISCPDLVPDLWRLADGFDVRSRSCLNVRSRRATDRQHCYRRAVAA